MCYKFKFDSFVNNIKEIKKLKIINMNFILLKKRKKKMNYIL